MNEVQGMIETIDHGDHYAVKVDCAVNSMTVFFNQSTFRFWIGDSRAYVRSAEEAEKLASYLTEWAKYKKATDHA